MENWIIYGLLASFCFSVQAVLYKVVYQKSNYTPYFSSFIFGFGILLAFFIFLFFKHGFNFEWKSASLLLISGIIWGIGFIAVAVAIAQKADLARLVPIINTNTLLTVFIGITFLKEIPDASQMWRVIGGAVLIVAGAVLVSI